MHHNTISPICAPECLMRAVDEEQRRFDQMAERYINKDKHDGRLRVDMHTFYAQEYLAAHGSAKGRISRSGRRMLEGKVLEGECKARCPDDFQTTGLRATNLWPFSMRAKPQRLSQNSSRAVFGHKARTPLFRSSSPSISGMKTCRIDRDEGQPSSSIDPAATLRFADRLRRRMDHPVSGADGTSIKNLRERIMGDFSRDDLTCDTHDNGMSVTAQMEQAERGERGRQVTRNPSTNERSDAVFPRAWMRHRVEDLSVYSGRPES
ncbi:hypothetical protein NM688_g297 [Phlebia brevispora]|uniref:Uncharacterized protein n=1 Tax=Phlebia brevispora TaxID=194682 RepID=A0ACC1TEQ6_9APHY|nr:hypothetical protein NM688_g297 [Phlebia brevispora]